MFASTLSAALVGVDPRPVTVEAHLGRGSGTFHVVGLPDTAVREAKERVKSAFAATSFSFPRQRVVVNLAPAALPKAGSAFDLPIALSVLEAAGLVPPATSNVVAVGELGLDGSIRHARGALAAALIAERSGIPCLVPPESAAQARLVRGADVRTVRTLAEAVVAAPNPPVEARNELREPASIPDLADVRGQSAARRVLEIAAAGGHHLLMVGPPGCGKTMLAKRLPGILPPLEEREQMQVACVYAAGDRPFPPSGAPPFRAPHHSASSAAILGGGSGVPVPGELALAHRGVLFLDELAEFPGNILDSLRQPLEDGTVTIARKGFTVTYPASIQLVGAANRCPCGFAGDRLRPCECSSSAQERYRRRLSGPLLDRFDLTLHVGRPERLDGPAGESSAVVRDRVVEARHLQRKRGVLNRELDRARLDRLAMTPAANALLIEASQNGVLTGRGYDRVRRVARTISDLGSEATVGESAVLEALSYRGGV